MQCAISILLPWSWEFGENLTPNQLHLQQNIPTPLEENKPKQTNTTGKIEKAIIPEKYYEERKKKLKIHRVSCTFLKLK